MDKRLKGLPETRVLLAVPSRETVTANFSFCFTAMALFSASRGIGLAFKNKKGSLIEQLREEMLDEALRSHATHLFFVDSDMAFPPDTLARLLARNCKVIAASCPTRQLEPQQTAHLVEGVPLDVWREPREVVRVARVGCGVMLIRLEAVRAIPQPRFPRVWKPRYKRYQGEDWGFCEVLEQNDISVMVDTRLSREIGHEGSFVVPMEWAKNSPFKALTVGEYQQKVKEDAECQQAPEELDADGSERGGKEEAQGERQEAAEEGGR